MARNRSRNARLLGNKSTRPSEGKEKARADLSESSLEKWLNSWAEHFTVEKHGKWTGPEKENKKVARLYTVYKQPAPTLYILT